MKFAVCDDEQETADHISAKLREYYPDECEIKKYEDSESLLNDMSRETFDAFFLDIGMPKLDGMKLARKIREDDRYVKIIFVTKREELAYMGYLYDAFRFIRKGKLESELREAAHSLKKYFDMLDKRLCFKTTDGEIIKALKDIIYFEGNGHVVTMVCDKYEYTLYGTMRDYCDMLKNEGFILVHKSYLVNFRYICFTEKNNVKLSCGKVLPLSRYRIDEVRDKLRYFLTHIER